MKRFWIALAWMGAVTVPALLMVVFLFGCCVLPFHQVLHHAFPICGGIVAFLIHSPMPPIPGGAATPPPARVQLTPLLGAVMTLFSSQRSALAVRIAPPISRAQLAFGGVPSERDVGLHLFNATLII